MAENPLRTKGRAMRRKLMGEAYAAKLDKSVYTNPIMEKFAEVTQVAIFGMLGPAGPRSEDANADLRHLGYGDGAYARS